VRARTAEEIQSSTAAFLPRGYGRARGMGGGDDRQFTAAAYNRVCVCARRRTEGLQQVASRPESGTHKGCAPPLSWCTCSTDAPIITGIRGLPPHGPRRILPRDELSRPFQICFSLTCVTTRGPIFPAGLYFKISRGRALHEMAIRSNRSDRLYPFGIPLIRSL
jgi:hypothetical protein